MCKGCWIEAGSPQIDNPAVRRAAKLTDGINPFGPCHIAVDDWNLEDEHLKFCLDLTDPAPNKEEVEWLEAMKALTVDERFSAVAIDEGCWTPKEEESDG